jgi:TamB, inner membrane protein subunit of TAM complex
MKVQITKKRVAKILLTAFAASVGLLLIAFVVLQMPTVQKALLDRYLGRIKNRTNFEITTKKLHLYWYDRLQVTELKIVDPQKNEMVSIDELLVNFQFFHVRDSGQINIDGVSLDSAKVKLVYIPESDTTKDININEFITAINKMFAPPPGKKGKSPKVNIGEIVLTNSVVSLHNPDKDSLRDGFDHNHFALSLFDSELNGFQVIGDTVQFNVLSLVGEEVTHAWPIHEAKTYFRTSQGGMEFLDLSLKAGQSYIGDTIVFKYNSTRDMADFVNAVSIQAKLRNCILHPNDILFFSPTAPAIPHPIELSGLFSGRVRHFYFSEMVLKMGNSSVAGTVEMDGLPAINETFINLRINPSSVDLANWQFALPPFAYAKLKPLGQIKLSGDFTGFYDDFVADGKIISKMGEIDSDINMKIDKDNLEQSSYTGNLQLTDFHLGEYMEDTLTFQHITLNGNITGNGLTTLTADFVMKGRVDSVGILGYDYHNIESNARFTKNFFNGSLTVHDPNLNCSVLGSVDFRNNADLINVHAKIDTARLQALKLIPQNFSFRTNLEINSKGLKLDSLRGMAMLTGIRLNYKDKYLALDSVTANSTINKAGRALILKSSLGSLDLEGNFLYTTMFRDIQNIFKEFYLNIQNNKTALADYYSQKEKYDQAYKAEFRAKMKDINPLLEFLKFDVEVSKNVSVEGDYTNGFTTIFHAYSSVPAIRYADKIFYNNDIEFNGSKIHDTTSVLALLTITSKTQNLNKRISSKDILLEAIWNHNHIDVGFDIDQQGYDNAMRIKAEIDFLTDSTRVRLLPSTVRSLGQEWTINPENLVLFKGKEWTIDQFEIRHNNESSLLSGHISEDASQALRILVKNVGLDLVNSLTQEKFKGTINADFTLKNLYGDFTFQNQFTIDKFTINDFVVGDVSGSTLWDPDQDAFIVNFFVDRLQNRIVDITGLYNPSDKHQALNLTARLNKTNLKIVEPIMRGLFSNWEGTATGAFDIGGTLAKPDITGSAQIENGKVTVDYLKTVYDIAGKLALNHNQILLQNIVLTDAYKNKGELNGIIAHKDFEKFRISLDASFNNLQVMNTTAKDNSLFYGQAYGTGILNIFGPFDDLKISATARTEKNTRMYIPVSGSTNVEKSDFITFVSFRDTVKKANTEETIVRKTKSNFSLSLNLDITPDAYGEIIFDLKAGDIIRGYGRGDIKLDMDTKGEFSMFGLYEFERGFYNFTLGGVINKEFAINRGSRISWFGDPYAGVVNINAGYRQLASIGPILTDPTLAQEPQLRRKFPIEVQLKLDGQMLAPQISFDIVAKELPESIVVEGRGTPVRPNFEFNAFKARLDEQELKKQVFSLIVLRRFSPPDAFTTSGGIANSVSEFLSNQLSYWLSQVDQNLEVNLDLGTLDQEAFNTFQLRMSYSFMNGRLRITRDGSLGSNQFARSEIASIAGDWTVDYLLTPDGKFKAKMYSRSNYNTLLSSIGTQTAVTTGLSLSHTQSFNEFADLIRSTRKKRQAATLLAPDAEIEEEDKEGN